MREGGRRWRSGSRRRSSSVRSVRTCVPWREQLGRGALELAHGGVRRTIGGNRDCGGAGRGSPRPLIFGYVRTVFGPGAREVFAEEAGRYGGYPAYAANFTRMGTLAEATAVIGDTATEIQTGLATFTSELDETVVRAITGEESADAYLALLEAAAPE